MNLSANGARLAGLTRELAGQWQQTRERWRDARGAEFERQYLEPLFAESDNAVTVIEQLHKLIAKLRSDCE